MTPDILKQLPKNLQYHFEHIGSTLNYDKSFYVILSGKAYICVPNPKYRP